MPQILTYELTDPESVQERWDVILHSSGPLTISGIGTYFSVDASSGAITVNLPAAASNTDRVINVKKTDSSSNAVTLDPNASETIDGQTTWALSTQYDSITIISNGSNWEIV